MSTFHKWGDAAFADNLEGTSFVGVGGYYGGPLAAHVWPESDWHRFPGFRLPIWVAGDPGNGPGEGADALRALEALGVPPGSRTVVDVETRHNREYVANFAQPLTAAGYLVETYGSLDNIFQLPPLNGYWVADYTSDMAVIDQLLLHPHVRAVQYADMGPYDLSLRKVWTQGEIWHG